MIDVRLQTPFSLIMAVPSNSGKTTLLINILKSKQTLFTTQPVKTRMYFSIWQPSYDYMRENKLVDDFVEGVPSASDLTTFQKSVPKTLIIFDDLAEQLSSAISDFFIAGCHHYDSNVILISQNLFQKNPIWRVCSLNTTYMILLKNPRDPSQVSTISRQAFPGQKNFLSSVCKYCSFLIYVFKFTSD